MIDLIENNSFLLALIIFVVLFLIWLGWKIRIWLKNFLFMLLKKRGKKGEINSIKLLKKKGYKVLDEQIRLNGYFFIDDALNKLEKLELMSQDKDGILTVVSLDKAL